MGLRKQIRNYILKNKKQKHFPNFSPCIYKPLKPLRVMDKLILLKRKTRLINAPYWGEIYEVHINEIRQRENLLFTLKSKELAEKIVKSFNEYNTQTK